MLLSPVSATGPAVACDADYLVEVRRICDEHGLLLLIDETQLVVGAAGKALTFASIAGIRADMVDGLRRALWRIARWTDPDFGNRLADTGQRSSTGFLGKPLCSVKHLLRCRSAGFPRSPTTRIILWRLKSPRTLGAFPFVRDIQATGLTSESKLTWQRSNYSGPRKGADCELA